MLSVEDQAAVWDFYKPRHTHVWNMLVVAFRQLDRDGGDAGSGFEIEYHWENLILRLWLYRVTIRSLVRLPVIKTDVEAALCRFDQAFDKNGVNQLKALRDMIEHFDDYAVGRGRGPATSVDLDPWRRFTTDSYERGQFRLNRENCLSAATDLRSDAELAGDKFISWYKAARVAKGS